MLGLGAPRVPAFPLVALAAGWSAAVHACVGALLPSAFADPAAPSTPVAAALAALHVPALLLHPILRAFPPRRPARVLALALAFDVVAALLVARAAALPNTVPDLANPYPFPSLLAAAMLIAGVSAVLTQSQTILHISNHMPSLHFHRDLGIHLSVVEGTGALFAALVPPLAAIAITSAHAPAFLPFAILAAIQVVQLPLCAAKLLQKVPGDSIPNLPTDEPLPSPIRAESSDVDGNVREIFLRRSTWLPMLAMFTAVASTVALRPILATHVVVDEGKSLVTSAILFSIMSMCAIIADTAVTALDLARLSRNAIIIFGLAVASFGFNLLSNPRYLYFAVVVIAVGANGALVLTLGHLAEQSGIEQLGQHDVATFIAFMVFAVGEAVGLVVSGIFRDWFGSFAASMVAWSKLVLLVAVVMSLELILAMTWSVLGYGSLARRTREYNTDDEARPLLGEAFS